MKKNRSIRDFLEFTVNNSIKLFQNEFSLPKVVQGEIDNLGNVQWLSTRGVGADNLKDEYKNGLIELLHDKPLHAELAHLVKALTDINSPEIQEDLERQLIHNFTHISMDISKEKRDYKLNLLFFEHDREPEACFGGYEDRGYKFKVLTGLEYLQFDYEKELFNGVGKLDYTPFMKPFLDYLEAIGEERADFINEALLGGEYLEEIKKLFVLNGYLGIHICLDRIKGKIREIDIPMMNEVFIFGNEHDCQHLNIFVL